MISIYNKFLATIMCLCLTSLGLTAQNEDFRKNPPKPGPAPEIQLADYESFTLDNGMDVIVVENDKLPRVSYQLSLDVPMHMEGENAGLSGMAGQLLRSGTTNRSKAELDEAVDFIGASLSTTGSGIFGSSLTKHKDELLKLMTDVLYNPAFPEDEFAKLKQQTISNIAASMDDPNFIAGNVARVMVYGSDHPYGEIQTQKTIEGLTADKCRMYYDKYFSPEIATLVIVGDLSMKEAKRDAEKYFGSWEGEKLSENEFAKPEPPSQTQVDFVDKSGSVQSVVDITYPIYLKPGDDDFIAVNVMNAILGGGSNGRLFKNIREDKGFTYGAYSNVSTDEEVGRFRAYASVRNEVTDSSLVEFMNEFERLRSEKVGDRELRLAKNNLAGSFARGLESAQQIANFARNTKRYNLPDDYYSNYLKMLSSVTADDVMRVAKKYLMPNNAHIVVVGSKSDVAEDLKAFGPINYFDAFGNPVESKAVSSDVTAQQVIDNYLEAIGGVDKLKSVTDLTVRMSTTVQGMALEVINEQMEPGMMHMKVMMNGNAMQEVTYDGEKAKVSQMGNAQTLEGEQAAGFETQAMIFPEMNYADMGAELSLEGIETVAEKDAYKVLVTLPDGSKTTQFYEVETGYKVKEVTTQEAQGQTVTQTSTFSDYQEVDGIMFPHKMQSSGAMPFPVDFKTEEIKVNAGLTKDTFKVE